MRSILFTLLAVLALAASVLARVTEDERVRLWHQNGNTWPPKWPSNESPERQYRMSLRDRDLQLIPGTNERWENYVQYTQSRLVPRFTEVGFKVVPIPPAIFQKLKEQVDAGIANWDNLRLEKQIDAVFTPLPSKFVDMHAVNQEVIRELQSMHEEWAGGIQLRATSAYGTRLYQNGSSLVMHHDKTTTHVISSIVHIAHEYDNDDEPWPIEIEDHDGKLHAVNLEPGQMLFYESAACLHGRRSKFKGKYYGSLFLHYQPVDTSIWNYSIEDVIAHVPPHWGEGLIEDKGSRWAGQGLTIDSLIPEGAPPRVIQGEIVSDINAYYAKHYPEHLARANSRVIPVPPAMFVNNALLLLVLAAVGIALVQAGRLTEDERVRQWHARGNTWPPTWQPETEAYKRNMELREEELMRLPGANERWENFMQFTASRMVPRFTPNGFKVIQTPPEIQAALKAELDKALLDFDSIREESKIDVLYTPIPSKFVDIPKVSREVHEALLPLHEEWSGLKLRPSSIYGIRMNRNGSSLIMHYDKIFTHVISSIIHVGHEYENDDEPWPIEIEDHDGNLHAVNLEAGQMLFYESASCLHGRRKVLKGKYYASIFAHYQPVDTVMWHWKNEDVINNVPPHWRDGIIEEKGSRHAGQGLTIDSRMSEAAPPRIIKGEVVHDIKAYYDNLRQQQQLNGEDEL